MGNSAKVAFACQQLRVNTLNAPGRRTHEHRVDEGGA